MDKKDINSLRWWQAAKLSKYAHFNKDDSEIWDSFIKSEASKFLRFAYDIPLNEPIPEDPNHPDYLAPDWQYLTAYKIDVIGEIYLTYICSKSSQF